MLISVAGTCNIQLEPRQESTAGRSSAVTSFFAKKWLTKPTGALEHCREEETNWWFSIFRAFPSDRNP
jgi:hypothetical protein